MNNKPEPTEPLRAATGSDKAAPNANTHHWLIDGASPTGTAIINGQRKLILRFGKPRAERLSPNS